MGPALHLDHASLHVADLDHALERLGSRFGLVATRTPAAPTWHSRIFLDRSYVEVSARPGRAAPSGWAIPLFFLRYEALPPMLDHLRAAGIGADVSEHAGVDGTWDDVSVSAPEGVPAPLLVRRTRPPEVAADWPPPLPAPQPCGAVALDAVHLRVAHLAPAVDFYRRLLALEARSLPTRDASSGGERIELPLASGRLALHSAEAGQPGVIGIALAVDSLARVEQTLDARGVSLRRGATAGGPECWLDPAETHGVLFGFRERAPATVR